MHKLVSGLHHVTALSAHPQKNLDFYAGILGLRLVKKTINFDAPDVYHLYYGNEKGEPGTLLTFFPFPGLPEGRKGNGQLTRISLSIPNNSIDYWQRRFKKFGVKCERPTSGFEDETRLYFEDFEGLGLALAANSRDTRKGFTYGIIPEEVAIKGFYAVALTEEESERTTQFLTEQMGHQFIGSNGNRFRYSASGKAGDFVDVFCCPDALPGIGGAGTVHHVAFATANEDSQLKARQKLWHAGVNVTPVLDREYFHSIYFREPGGVLFEIATLPPGFTVDEELASLGSALKLPPWQEENRKIIEKELPPLHLDLARFKD
jgi:glyoxalase family protein